jgi:hypothetical protein
MKVPAETNKKRPNESIAGFEIVLSITIILAVYIIGRKMR